MCTYCMSDVLHVIHSVVHPSIPWTSRAASRVAPEGDDDDDDDDAGNDDDDARERCFRHARGAARLGDAVQGDDDAALDRGASIDDDDDVRAPAPRGVANARRHGGVLERKGG